MGENRSYAYSQSKLAIPAAFLYTSPLIQGSDPWQKGKAATEGRDQGSQRRDHTNNGSVADDGRVGSSFVARHWRSRPNGLKRPPRSLFPSALPRNRVSDESEEVSRTHWRPSPERVTTLRPVRI
ncbi:hypothetical protein VTI74DRAFT_2469 [Chaetomium olivicolor]